jgi:hypothetical protein
MKEFPNFPPPGLEPMPHISMALTVQYLNVRQLKLGTITSHHTHCPYPDNADTDSSSRPLLWIRVGSNADPDPAFFVSADTVLDPVQIQQHQGFDDQKLEKNYS